MQKESTENGMLLEGKKTLFYMKNWGAIIIKWINLRLFTDGCVYTVYPPQSIPSPLRTAKKINETIIYKILIVSRLVFQTVQVQYNEPIGNIAKKNRGSKTII